MAYFRKEKLFYLNHRRLFVFRFLTYFHRTKRNRQPIKTIVFLGYKVNNQVARSFDDQHFLKDLKSHFSSP